MFKRYAFSTKETFSGDGEFLHSDITTQEHPDGLWVKFEDVDVSKVTRVELIDHRLPFGETGVKSGRVYSAHNCKITLSYQDNNRTLKVFIDGER